MAGDTSHVYYLYNIYFKIFFWSLNYKMWIKRNGWVLLVSEDGWTIRAPSLTGSCNQVQWLGVFWVADPSTIKLQVVIVSESSAWRMEQSAYLCVSLVPVFIGVCDWVCQPPGGARSWVSGVVSTEWVEVTSPWNRNQWGDGGCGGVLTASPRHHQLRTCLGGDRGGITDQESLRPSRAFVGHPRSVFMYWSQT